MRSSWEATAAKSRADSNAALVRFLLITDAGQHALDGLGDLHGLRTPRTCTSSGLDCALMAACWASRRNGVTMISEIIQPTRQRPDDHAADQRTRRYNSSTAAWVSAIGAPERDRRDPW